MGVQPTLSRPVANMSTSRAKPIICETTTCFEAKLGLVPWQTATAAVQQHCCLKPAHTCCMCCRNATSILGQITLLDHHLHQQHKLLWPSATRVGQLNSLAKAHQPGPDLQQLYRSHSPVVGPVTCLSSVAEAVLDRQSADWQPPLNLAAAVTTTAVGAEQLFRYFAI